MRGLEQARREAEAISRQESRELEGRLDAERSAPRASLAPIRDSEWWDSARPDDIGLAWEIANAWRDLDPDLAALRWARELDDERVWAIEDVRGVSRRRERSQPRPTWPAKSRRQDPQRREAAAHGGVGAGEAQVVEHRGAVLQLEASSPPAITSPGGTGWKAGGPIIGVDPTWRARHSRRFASCVADGRIAEWWGVADLLGALERVGGG